MSDLSIERLSYCLCRGGWPRTFEIKDDNAKLLIARDYFKQVINVDISRIDNVKRNSKWAATILKSYARNIGTLAKKTNHIFRCEQSI